MPISKPEKDPKIISSYRPINNLPSIEKIIESHILDHITKFFNDNKIINDYHHGGRPKHSTTTALSDMTYTLNKLTEQKYITATLTTDLTAAYDTVDSNILLEKLHYYGIR